MNEIEAKAAMAAYRAKRVGHRVAKGARTRLLRRILTAENEQVLALIGPAGVGKTAVVERVCQLLDEHFRDEMLKDPGFIPYLSVTTVTGLNGDYSWRDGFARLLAAGAEPLIGKKTTFPCLQLDGNAIATTKGLLKDEFRRSLESMVKHRRIRVIFMDEGSSIIDETVNRHPLRQFNILKSLAVAMRVTIVLIGAYDLAGIKDGNGQLIRRSECIHMPRYKLDAETSSTDCTAAVGARDEDVDSSHPDEATDLEVFSDAVDTLAATSPVTIAPGVLSDKSALLGRSVGCVGNFRNWPDRASLDALLENNGVLTQKIMEGAALELSALKTLTVEAMLGEICMLDIDEEAVAQAIASVGNATASKSVDEKLAPSRAGQRKPGQRNPSRDTVGGAHA